jgi:uncharacterized protein
MKSTAIALVTLLCSLCTPNTFATPADTAHSVIWEVSANGLTKPSYIFGILHLICPEDYVWTGVMRDCFHSSNSVCFAEHMKETTGMDDKAVIDSTGKTIRDYFSAKDYDDVRDYFQRRAHINIDVKQNNMISTMIAWLIKSDLGCGDPVSYETRLNKLAAIDKKKVTILDDLVEEAGDLEEMPADKIVRRAISRAHGDSAARMELAGVIAAYKRQDQAKLRDLLSHLGYYRGETKLDEENDKWVPLMREKMRDESVFFVVGAAHIGGDHGLVSMLRDKGYKVRPVGLVDTASVLEILPKPNVNLAQYMQEHLQLPGKAIKHHIQGTVTVQFLVTETGKIKKCTLVRGVNHACDKRVVKVVKKMPAYQPGLKHGKPAEFWLIEKFQVGEK